MFAIGDFARHGSVSIRMLRHYDAEGLLRPAWVDPATGYRYYAATQLSRLNRIIALRSLGFGLAQIRDVLDEPVSVEQLRGMLRLRHAELDERIGADLRRLHQVEARLRMIESEGRMSEVDVVVKALPGARLAELSGYADSYEHESIGPVVQGLYADLGERLGRAGVEVTGPAVAHYTPADGGKVEVRAGLTVSAEPGSVPELPIVDVPPVAAAATLVHHGLMNQIGGKFQELARWIEANGYQPDGAAREYYLVTMPEPESEWVTELQQPVSPVAAT